MKTLEQILEKTKNGNLNGEYGINACKESVKNLAKLCYDNSLYKCLEGMMKRRAELEKEHAEWSFNDNMIQACWQLINNR